MKRTILFTIDSNVTGNARQVCENQNGKEYTSVQEFIDTLTQYELIHDESEVVIYEVCDFVNEFNIFPTGDNLNNDTMNDSFMGYIQVG